MNWRCLSPNDGNQTKLFSLKPGEETTVALQIFLFPLATAQDGEVEHGLEFCNAWVTISSPPFS